MIRLCWQLLVGCVNPKQAQRRKVRHAQGGEGGSHLKTKVGGEEEGLDAGFAYVLRKEDEGGLSLRVRRIVVVKAARVGEVEGPERDRCEDLVYQGVMIERARCLRALQTRESECER